MKGIDKYIMDLARYECPFESGLKDVRRVDLPNCEYGQCKYGEPEGTDLSVCIDCWVKAFELDYEE